MITTNSIWLKEINNADTQYSLCERKLFGIIWALGQFQRPHPMLTINQHSPLRHILNQNSIGPRIRKWISSMQDYSLEIQHIFGKVNPADNLSRQSVTNAFEHKD